MNGKVAMSILFLLGFIGGSIYNLNIRKGCLYPIKITKARKILSVLAFFIFSFVAYIGGNLWYYYVVAVAGAIYLISSIVGQGIHEKGIYYQGIGPGSTIIKLAKWENIHDIKIDETKNKLESFRVKTNKIEPDQYYNPEDIPQIIKFVEE